MTRTHAADVQLSHLGCSREPVLTLACIDLCFFFSFHKQISGAVPAGTLMDKNSADNDQNLQARNKANKQTQNICNCPVEVQ